jgi:hypothetical protein
VVDSDSQIRATAPNAHGQYTSSSTLGVKVTTPAGTVEGAGGVQFGDEAAATPQAVAPTVASFSPMKVPVEGGVEVTITGTGFTGATSVMFSELSAQFVVDSDSQIRATAPNAHGQYTSSSTLGVKVTTPAGSAEGAGGVQFGDPPS